MARRNLSVRQTMRALGDLAGRRIVVAKSLSGDPGVVYSPGEDVTEIAKDWPTLFTHVKRGYLLIVDAAESVKAVKVAVSSPTKSNIDFAVREVAESVASTVDLLSDLRSLNATASKRELRDALEKAGVIVPADSGKDALLRLRASTLEN